MPDDDGFINSNIRVKIEEEVYNKIGALAAWRGVNKTEVVADALREYVKKHQGEIPRR